MIYSSVAIYSPCRLLGIFIIAALLLSTIPSLYAERRLVHGTTTFRLGELHTTLQAQSASEQEWATEVYRYILRCVETEVQATNSVDRERIAQLVYRHVQAAQGLSLTDHAARLLPAFETRNKWLSHMFNVCACTSPEPIYTSEAPPVVKNGSEQLRQELMAHASLALWPGNVMTVKNLAHELEWQHHVPVEVPLSLLEQLLQLLGSGDAAKESEQDVGALVGVLMQQAFMSETIFWSTAAEFRRHVKILSRANDIMRLQVPWHDTDPTTSVREIQLNPQYLGISPGVQAEAYSMCLQHLFPSVSTSKFQVAPAHPPVGAAKRIRLGVVSEHENNSSPGVVLTQLLQELSKLTHVGPDGTQLSDYELIFFGRPNSQTVFSSTLMRVSQRSLELLEIPGNLERNRQIIVAEHIDILLYIALPTEKLTSFLAHSRLAPVQIVFGIGHPLTSGINTVDYSIVSADMFHSLHMLAAPQPDVKECLRAAPACEAELAKDPQHLGGQHCSYMRRIGCASDAAPSPADGNYNTQGIAEAAAHYTEQLVVFDSLAYFLDSHLLIYREPITPLALAFDSPCDELNARLRKWGVHVQLQAEQIGCIATSGQRLPRVRRIYTCIQIPRKMHSSFDAAVVGLLHSDPAAILLVEARTKQFFPRWLRAGVSEADLEARVVLIPRLSHPNYLQLLSLSSVFLNTFPFGAGITSSEAISVCVPVVVHAEVSSVLHLALAQVRRLGHRWETQWVAHSVADYVQRAVRLANVPNAREYRQAICDDRVRLMGNDTLHEAVREWDAFLKRAWEGYA